MARSSFRLPNLQELSKEQRNALDTPLEGQCLVVGGPGTGKSVVALLRAQRLERNDKNYLFLVYNVLLENNSYALGGTELKATTWKKWFKINFNVWFGCNMPTIKDGNNEQEDWDAILKLHILDNMNTSSYNDPSSLYIVIDEGQDMPEEFYRTLIDIGFQNFYIVADQNQAITNQNSSMLQIRDVLGLGVAQQYDLTKNYRNAYPIARLSQAFYTNDPASPPVKLPEPKDGATIPKLVQYGNGLKYTIEWFAEQLLKKYDRYTDKLLCIITPNNSTREKFCDILNGVCKNMTLDHDAPHIQTYSTIDKTLATHANMPTSCYKCGKPMRLKNGENGSFWGCSGYPGCENTKPYVDIDLKEGGICVINAQSIKGLEFESVYISDIDVFDYEKDDDLLKKKFYVMTSRARETIMLLRTGEISQRIEAILPDNKILQRRG